MKLVQVAEQNKKYFTKDFIHGFNTGAKTQYEADKKERLGLWEDIEHAPNGLHYATCSVCGERQTIEVANYCPMCGASMMDDNAIQHTKCVGNALDALDEVEE